MVSLWVFLLGCIFIVVIIIFGSLGIIYSENTFNCIRDPVVPCYADWQCNPSTPSSLSSASDDTSTSSPYPYVTHYGQYASICPNGVCLGQANCDPLDFNTANQTYAGYSPYSGNTPIGGTQGGANVIYPGVTTGTGAGTATQPTRSICTIPTGIVSNPPTS